MTRPFRLLLIDDDLADLELTARALAAQREPYELLTAASGEAALALLAQTRQDQARPDLILLDLNMPGMHGLDVLSRLKEGARTRTIPVVILTTSDDHGDIERAYHGHANGFVVKPSLLLDQQALMAGLLRYWTRTALTHWPEPRGD